MPGELLGQWTCYRDSLVHLQLISVPRCLDPFHNSYQEIHGFCDASEKAYAAVVYLRCCQSDSVRVTIIAAKTKVAPLKQVSLPRLELCAALLLARLTESVVHAINLVCPISAWSDSEVALSWISSSSRRWKTFVANRVAEIQEVIPGESWHYVPTEENPADCASRGVSGKQLANHPLWWSGPPWLSLPEVPRFGREAADRATVEAEQREPPKLSHPAKFQEEFIERFSTLTKLKYVMSFVCRFIHNCRVPAEQRARGQLSAAELENGLLVCVKVAQKEDLQEEIKLLERGQLIKSGRLCSFNPFLDKFGILRVGGRVKRAAERQQILLDGRNHLTRLLIRHVHIVLLHAGFQLLWSTLARKYWILRTRNVLRKVIRACVVCKRQRGGTAKQMMGQLPEVRTTPSRPFTHTGVDYAGPVRLQAVKGRGSLQFKAYFCLFVCMATKAVHLEAVTDLTAEVFIATLKRFISRRGVPTDMYSDQGTNFIGAERELKRFLVLARHDAVAHFSREQAILWHFNPPSAPHMGGLWEAGVKSAKYHLKRVIGKQVLTLEEYFTLLAQVEAALNSRPLCPLSPEPEDCDVLTPGHFLIGQPLRALPEPCHLDVNSSRLSRWQRVQQMFQHFWKRCTLFQNPTQLCGLIFSAIPIYFSALSQNPKSEFRNNARFGRKLTFDPVTFDLDYLGTQWSQRPADFIFGKPRARAFQRYPICMRS